MARGRMISKSIAVCGQLKGVSLEADFLFGRIIPHLDRDGRTYADPDVIKATACPLRRELSVEVVARCITELAVAELISLYEVDGAQYLWCPGFAAHQGGFHYAREAASRIPPPNAPGVTPPAGPTRLRTKSGPAPDEVRAREVKRSEVKKTGRPASGEADSNKRNGNRRGVPSASWPAVGTEWWQKKVGHVTQGQFGKMLKPVVDLHGWDATFAGIVEWFDHRKLFNKELNLAWFVKDSARWIEQAAMPTTDERGDLTARGKRIVGVTV